MLWYRKQCRNDRKGVVVRKADAARRKPSPMCSTAEPECMRRYTSSDAVVVSRDGSAILECTYFPCTRRQSILLLALGVVNLTRFSLITASAEDQLYFSRYETHAHIERSHQAIIEACDVLYQVQTAEEEARAAHRGRLVNGLLFTLTSLTLLSVFTDTYNFLTGQGPSDIHGARLIFVLSLLGSFFVLVAVLLFFPRSTVTNALRARTKRR